MSGAPRREKVLAWASLSAPGPPHAADGITGIDQGGSGPAAELGEWLPEVRAMPERRAQPSDEQFLQGLVNGEEWAVAELRKMVHVGVQRFGSATARREDAEDAEQYAVTGVLEVFRKGTYPQPLTSLRAFIRERIYRELVNWTRLNGARVAQLEPPEIADPSERPAFARLFTKQVVDTLLLCLGKVELRWRVAWIVTRLDLSRRQAATLLAATDDQIRNWVYQTQLWVESCPELQPYLPEAQEA
jgi:DNA-directed RNA polymerase specialized sigma24 family protein